MQETHVESWTIDHSVDTYQIDRWGNDFFSIGENGHIMVHPTQSKEIAWALVPCSCATWTRRAPQRALGRTPAR